VDEYAGFMLVEEIDRFMKIFQTDVNVFRNVEKEVCYRKQCSYIYSEKAMFVLNVGTLDFLKYHCGSSEGFREGIREFFV
jgi:hypothetical protein